MGLQPHRYLSGLRLAGLGRVDSVALASLLGMMSQLQTFNITNCELSAAPDLASWGAQSLTMATLSALRWPDLDGDDHSFALSTAGEPCVLPALQEMWLYESASPVAVVDHSELRSLCLFDHKGQRVEIRNAPRLELLKLVCHSPARLSLSGCPRSSR